jgi:ABC-type ATPase with predicted acetyltransferase domain
MKWKCRFCSADVGAPLVPACPECGRDNPEGGSVSVFVPNEPLPVDDDEPEPEPEP